MLDYQVLGEQFHTRVLLGALALENVITHEENVMRTACVLLQHVLCS